MFVRKHKIVSDNDHTSEQAAQRLTQEVEDLTFQSSEVRKTIEYFHDLSQRIRAGRNRATFEGGAEKRKNETWHDNFIQSAKETMGSQSCNFGGKLQPYNSLKSVKREDKV